MQPAGDDRGKAMRASANRLVAVAFVLGTGATADAATITYRAMLDGASESPPVVTPGTGTATVVLDTLAKTMRVRASFADLIGSVTIAHIHGPTAAPFFGNAPVITPLPSFPGFPAGVTAGSYDMTFDLTDPASYSPGFLTANGGVPEVAADTLAAALAGRTTYLNIHTSYAASGEIRGFLTPVPLPAPLGMLAAALCGAGLMARGRAAAA